VTDKKKIGKFALIGLGAIAIVKLWINSLYRIIPQKLSDGKLVLSSNEAIKQLERTPVLRKGVNIQSLIGYGIILPILHKGAKAKNESPYPIDIGSKTIQPGEAFGRIKSMNFAINKNYYRFQVYSFMINGEEVFIQGASLYKDLSKWIEVI